MLAQKWNGVSGLLCTHVQVHMCRCGRAGQLDGWILQESSHRTLRSEDLKTKKNPDVFQTFFLSILQHPLARITYRYFQTLT